MTSKNKQSLDESEQQRVDHMVRSRRLIVVAEGGGASVSARSHEDRARDTWCVNCTTWEKRSPARQVRFHHVHVR